MRITANRQKSLEILKLTLIGLGFLLVTWNLFFRSELVNKEIPKEFSGEPDYFVTQAKVKKYSEEGELEYQLRSNSISHYESRLITELEKPQIKLMDKNQTPWSVSAEFGLITTKPETSSVNSNDEQFLLQDNVVISTAGTNVDFFHLKTQSLYLYPKSRHIESDKQITIETKQYRITAANITGRLDTRWVNLGSSPEQRVLIQGLTNTLE